MVPQPGFELAGAFQVGLRRRESAGAVVEVTCGLILAAGESRRMGSPKALLQFQGETFLDRLIGLFSRRCSPVIASPPSAVAIAINV